MRINQVFVELHFPLEETCVYFAAPILNQYEKSLMLIESSVPNWLTCNNTFGFPHFNLVAHITVHWPHGASMILVNSSLENCGNLLLHKLLTGKCIHGWTGSHLITTCYIGYGLPSRNKLLHWVVIWQNYPIYIIVGVVMFLHLGNLKCHWYMQAVGIAYGMYCTISICTCVVK